MKRYKIIYLSLILLISLFTGTCLAGEYDFDYQKIVEISDPLVLDLTLIQGKVTIIGTQENRVVIDAIKIIRASNEDEAEEVADHIEIKVREESNKVTIETNYLKMINRNRSFWSKFLGAGNTVSFGQVDYTISVPIRTSVIINSNEALIDISSIEGDIQITNAAGVTKTEYIFGHIEVAQPLGEIELNWIEGNIRIKSTLAKIDIKQLKGSLDIATNSSEVKIETELDSPNDFYVETTSGKIDLTVPNTATGELKIQTETGKISSDIPITVKSVSRNRLVGIIGDGGASINIVSTTGDVSVKQF